MTDVETVSFADFYTPPPEEFKGWTRENLFDVKRKRGFTALRDIGQTMGVKSTSSEGMINKILDAQDRKREALQPVGDYKFECLNQDMLYHRPVNMEEGIGPDDVSRPRHPPLVDQREGEMIIDALKKFGTRWGFTFEFMLKFQAFRCYKDGQHVDWIQLNELCKMYSLPINPAVMFLAKRMYTAPNVRAWRPE